MTPSDMEIMIATLTAKQARRGCLEPNSFETLILQVYNTT